MGGEERGKCVVMFAWCDTTKKSDTIYRLPSNYSFPRRTLKRTCGCDCPEQFIGIYLLEPTKYSCTCLHAAVLCSCARKIWVPYCTHKPSGPLLRPVPQLASKLAIIDIYYTSVCPVPKAQVCEGGEANFLLIFPPSFLSLFLYVFPLHLPS